jgi:hypothetical protein
MYDRDGEPERAIISVLDSDGCRTFANSFEREILDDLATRDACASPVVIDPSGNVPIVVSIE